MIKILKLIKQYNKESKYIKEDIKILDYIRCYLKIEKYERGKITIKKLNDFLENYGMEYNNRKK